MCAYTGIIIIYNLVFDQNLLDLRYPTLDIEQRLGEWPIYVVVNALLALTWYYCNYNSIKNDKSVVNSTPPWRLHFLFLGACDQSAAAFFFYVSS